MVSETGSFIARLVAEAPDTASTSTLLAFSISAGTTFKAFFATSSLS
jgi:hypothetical protein